MSPRARALAAVLLAAVLAGCAHYPLNARLEHWTKGAGYRFPPAVPGAPDPADELFVCLTFSGGGTRAAALAHGVMQKLRETRIDRHGLRSLLDEVDCIAGVSGGAFAAAYYGLFRDRLFADFEARFLTRDIQGELLARVLSPPSLVRLASPYFSRIDLAAELYDETVFDGKTFADLDPRRRPFILVTATNMATGARFEFTQEEFDLLGSSLGAFPVARAVAASSAFPFLLSPVSLAAYPAPAGFELSPEYTNALRDRERNPSRYYWARHRLDLAQDTPKWLHLMDGGLADNIGLRAVISAWERSGGFLGPRIDAGHVRRLVIVVVNARTDPPDALGRRERSPGLLAVGLKTATVAMEHYSLDTVALIRGLQTAREQAQRDIAECNRRLRLCGAPALPEPERYIRTCVVEVNFEALEPADRRQRFLSLPTTFTLAPETVRELIAVGGELLDASPDFQKLLRALRGEPALGDGIGEQGNCS